MNVHADADIGGKRCCGRQRFVAAGERGVHSNHAAATTTQEPLVFRQPAASTVDAVPVGDSIRQIGAHADRRARVGDDRQTALNGGG